MIKNLAKHSQIEITIKRKDEHNCTNRLMKIKLQDNNVDTIQVGARELSVGPPKKSCLEIRCNPV